MLSICWNKTCDEQCPRCNQANSSYWLIKIDEESLNTNRTENGICFYLRLCIFLCQRAKVPDTGLTSSTSDRGLLDKGEAIGQTDVTQHLKCLTLSFFMRDIMSPKITFLQMFKGFFQVCCSSRKNAKAISNHWLPLKRRWEGEGYRASF